MLQEAADNKGLSMDKGWTRGECFPECRGRRALPQDVREQQGDPRGASDWTGPAS